MDENTSIGVDQVQQLLCSACGKDMVNPRNGAALVGINLSVILSANEHSHDDLEFYKRQLGEYGDALGSDGSYEANVCWECWLKSLGVKAKKESEEWI